MDELDVLLGITISNTGWLFDVTPLKLTLCDPAVENTGSVIVAYVSLNVPDVVIAPPVVPSAPVVKPAPALTLVTPMSSFAGDVAHRGSSDTANIVSPTSSNTA